MNANSQVALFYLRYVQTGTNSAWHAYLQILHFTLFTQCLFVTTCILVLLKSYANCSDMPVLYAVYCAHDPYINNNESGGRKWMLQLDCMGSLRLVTFIAVCRHLCSVWLILLYIHNAPNNCVIIFLTKSAVANQTPLSLIRICAVCNYWFVPG